jgi:hypothetical protein
MLGFCFFLHVHFIFSVGLVDCYGLLVVDCCFHWLSLFFIAYHCFSLFSGVSLLFIGLHCVSLVSIDLKSIFHYFHVFVVLIVFH